MPNQCENHTQVFGPTADVWKFRQATQDKEGQYFLSNLIPMPDDIGDGWRTWAHDNWGTKWGDYEHLFDDPFDVEDNNDGTSTLSVSYYTAWGPFSAGFWRTVSQMFPTLRFDTSYEEPGMGFAGAMCAREGACSDEYTEDLPDFPDGDDYADHVQDWSDAMCDLREEMLRKASLEMTA
jgi:hypothetical protein